MISKDFFKISPRKFFAENQVHFYFQAGGFSEDKLVYLGLTCKPIRSVSTGIVVHILFSFMSIFTILHISYRNAQNVKQK